MQDNRAIQRREPTAITVGPAIKTRIEHIAHESKDLLLRAGYTPEAYARVMVNALVLNPGIADCSNQSIDQAMLKLMNAGLMPDGQEAAIVPFKKVATVIPMVEGRLKLARQASPGITIRAMAVYGGDEWDYAEGLEPRLHHVPNPTASKHKDNLLYTYAIARFPSGGYEYDVMDRATIDRYRAMSLSKTGGPWEDHFEEMSKNAVLKRLCKRLPKSAHDPGPLPDELDGIDTVADAAGFQDGPMVTPGPWVEPVVVADEVDAYQPQGGDGYRQAALEQAAAVNHAISNAQSGHEEPPPMEADDDDSPF